MARTEEVALGGQCFPFDGKGSRVASFDALMRFHSSEYHQHV